MSGSASGNVKNTSQLLFEFADGQNLGAILPSDVRDLIVSIGAIAGAINQVPIYQEGAGNNAITVYPSNGHIQQIQLNLGGNCAITLATGNELASSRIRLEIYVVQNTSGTGTVSWGSNVTWTFANQPQVSMDASSINLFNIVSVDGGTNWIIV